MEKSKITKRFGKKVMAVEGFVDFLEKQRDAVMDVAVYKDERGEKVGAFILDHHWWSSGSGGIGMASVVGMFFEGKSETESFTYRDQYSPGKDRWERCYTEIAFFVPERCSIKLRVSVRGNEGATSVYFKNPILKCEKCHKNNAERETIFNICLCEECFKKLKEKIDKDEEVKRKARKKVAWACNTYTVHDMHEVFDEFIKGGD